MMEQVIIALVVGTSIADFDAGDIAVADADNDGDQDILICGIKAGWHKDIRALRK